jgi:hypothetical protein
MLSKHGNVSTLEIVGRTDFTSHPSDMILIYIKFKSNLITILLEGICARYKMDLMEFTELCDFSFKLF